MTTTSRIHRRSSNLPCLTYTKCYTFVLYGIPALNSHEEFQFFYIIKISASLMLLTVFTLQYSSGFSKCLICKNLYISTVVWIEKFHLNWEVSLAKLSNLLLMEHQPFNKSISLICGPNLISTEWIAFSHL